MAWQVCELFSIFFLFGFLNRGLSARGFLACGTFHSSVFDVRVMFLFEFYIYIFFFWLLPFLHFFSLLVFAVFFFCFFFMLLFCGCCCHWCCCFVTRNPFVSVVYWNCQLPQRVCVRRVRLSFSFARQSVRGAFVTPSASLDGHSSPVGGVLRCATFQITGSRCRRASNSDSRFGISAAESKAERSDATRHTATRSLGQAQKQPKNSPKKPTRTQARKAAKGTRQDNSGHRLAGIGYWGLWNSELGIGAGGKWHTSSRLAKQRQGVAGAKDEGGKNKFTRKPCGFAWGIRKCSCT